LAEKGEFVLNLETQLISKVALEITFKGFQNTRTDSLSTYYLTLNWASLQRKKIKGLSTFVAFT
jgi:hypothetical protein